MKRRLTVRKLGRAAEKAFLAGLVALMTHYAAITNALGDATVYEYDHRGNKTYEGGATYPVRYTYDVYGNKTTMITYRHEPDGGGVGHVALPTTGDAPTDDMTLGDTTVGRGVLTAPPGDTTTWFYDEASGVMTNKVYADGKGPSYTYIDDGKLATRTWARGIVTTYAYDGWGNLIETEYSDNTPTVTVAYDAFSRQVEVHDAAGVTLAMPSTAHARRSSATTSIPAASPRCR